MSTATLTGLRDYLYGTLSPANMLWLGTQLTEYARRKDPYTMDELNERIAKSERDAAEGRYRSHEEVFASLMN